MYFVYSYEYEDNIVCAYYDTYSSKIVLTCPKTTSLIKNHQIPHYLIKLEQGGVYWALIIEDKDAAFVVLCGLNLYKVENVNRTAQHINFLFNDWGD